MPQGNRANLWTERLRQWLNHWAVRLGLRRRIVPPRPDTPYPDYVTCPHCGEPEVEVWCNEKTARCHNCGQTFEHPLPAEWKNGAAGIPAKQSPTQE